MTCAQQTISLRSLPYAQHSVSEVSQQSIIVLTSCYFIVKGEYRAPSVTEVLQLASVQGLSNPTLRAEAFASALVQSQSRLVRWC